MKTPVVITLIVAGTLILLAPPLSNAMLQWNTRQLLESVIKGTQAQNYHSELPGEMSEKYALGCYFAGIGMILVGILGARQESKREIATMAQSREANA